MKLLHVFIASCACFFFIGHTQAQVHVNVGVNIGTQPAWCPEGCDRVEYYYLPDINTYYYVPRHQFIYLEYGRWVAAGCLPSRCGSYDLYRGYKVVINEPRPWQRDEYYRERYCHHRDWDDDDDDHEHWEHHGHGWGHYKHHHRDEGDE